MKHYILGIILFFMVCTGQKLLAQCNNELIEVAASKSGLNAVYIREFKAKLKAGTPKKPTPVARFSTLLNEGVNYRFTVANAKEFEGKAVLQLYDKGKLLGSTYRERSDFESFDFSPVKTGVYRILMSFQSGKKGCAAGVLSMLLNDTTKVFDHRVESEQTQLEKLYIGIDNEISVAASGIPGGSIEVGIDKGNVTGSKGDYIIKVDEPGLAILTVITKDRNGIIKETSQTQFWITELPFPTALAAGSAGGIINKNTLLIEDQLHLSYQSSGIRKGNYVIIGFNISNNSDPNKGLSSRGSYFTTQQKNFIRKLNPGDKLYINNIQIQRDDGNTSTLQPIGFIIE